MLSLIILTVIFLPVSPASYTHNLVSGTHKIYTCESLNSQNMMENCSKICTGLDFILGLIKYQSWESFGLSRTKR